MRVLHHLPLSPFCRKVRLALAEKRLEFTLELERVWEGREEFLALNPAGRVPVLVDEGRAICDSQVIGEYLEEAYGEVPLLPKAPLERAEARRLARWFDEIFHEEVTVNVLYEKVNKRLWRREAPDMAAIREGVSNLKGHLTLIGKLAEERHWLAGEKLTLADLAAGAHLSCLDYLGDVAWNEHEGAKNWYARLKSRPSFRPLLADVIPGMPPARHYTNLDF